MLQRLRFTAFHYEWIVEIVAQSNVFHSQRDL